MKKCRFVFLPLFSLCTIGVLSGCGEDGSSSGDVSISSVESASIYDPGADEAKFTDFSLAYYPEKGGYFVGDYKGKETAIVVPDEATGEDGITAPIVGLSDYAFYGRTNLKTVVLGKKLRYIGDNAFSESGVTDLRVDLGLGDVSSNAFANSNVKFYDWNGRKYLPSLDNPYFMTFYSKNNVYSLSPQTKLLVYPRGTTEIPGGEYDATTSKISIPEFEAIGFPDGVVRIKAAAFKGCSSLKQLNFPNTLQTIVGDSFQQCNSLASIVLPDSVEFIGSSFAKCTGLQSIVLSKSMDATNVDGAFRFTNCTALKKVVLPEGIQTIGRYAFQGCSSLEEVELPSTIRSAGEDAFKGCPASLFHEHEGLNYVGPKANPYFFLVEKAGNTPEVCHIHPDCKIIGKGACQVDDLTKEIVIPAGCNVREEAITNSWGGNTKVAKVTFLGVPGGVDRTSFTYCGDLNFTTYGVARYLGNDENPHMVLYDVPDQTAEGELIHPDCNLIGGQAFRSSTTGTNPPVSQTFWPKLTSIAIPSKVQRICEKAFYDVRYSGSLVIEDAPVAIGDYAFSNTPLSSVSLGNAVTSIGSNAFSRDWTDTLPVAPQFSSISVPQTCTFLGEEAFYGCEKLETVSLPNSLVSIPNACFTATAIKTFSVPASVKEIEDYAFSACAALETFYIPASVKTIQQFAFYNCTALKNVYAEATSKPDGWRCSFGEATVTYGYQPS